MTQNKFYLLNREFYLCKKDIGSLLCVKEKNYWYNSYEEHACLLINLFFKKNNIRPNKMIIFCFDGKIKLIELTDNNRIEVCFL